MLDLPESYRWILAVAAWLTLLISEYCWSPRSGGLWAPSSYMGRGRFSKNPTDHRESKAGIRALFLWLPLHNPANYLGIRSGKQIFKAARQVSCFWYGISQSMEPIAYRMANSNEFYEKAGDFEDTAFMERVQICLRIAVETSAKARLEVNHDSSGNGCSMAAIRGGKCIDTSMGFLAEWMAWSWGRESWGISIKSVIFHLVNELGYSFWMRVEFDLDKKSECLAWQDFSRYAR